MSSDRIPFLKSLRFRLTLLYSTILFLFCSLFVLAINLYLNEYLNQEPPIRSDIYILSQQRSGVVIKDFDDAQLQIVRNMRLADLQRIRDVSILSLIPLFVASFAAGYYVAGNSLRPLRKLQEKVDTLKDSDLGSEVDISSDDEIGSLARSFNDMSKRLKRSFDNQTQFVQDASHELKTPLTVIQTNLDTVLDDDGISKEDLKNSIRVALTGMKRINHLTENLLALTLPEKLHKKKESVNDVVQTQIDSLNMFAKQNNVNLEFKKLERDIELNIDRDLLGQAIYNLAENAIKYSKKDDSAKVVISISKRKGNMVDIRVHDNGIGIPKEYQEKIFDRFFRVDKSRARNSGGFGLGLAIVKKIVDAHNGTISLESGDGNTEFTVTLKTL